MAMKIGLYSKIAVLKDLIEIIHLCKAWILQSLYYSTFITFVSSNSKLPITSYKMPLSSKNIYKGSHKKYYQCKRDKSVSEL